ncbi:MAG: adenosylmethionine decarboxylase [bacterium]
MKTSGIQLIAEFIHCPPNLLNDENQLSLALTEGIQQCGMHQVNLTSHKFDPVGVTVISIINESHIAMHIYPEAHHASIDIFHCSSESHSIIENVNFGRMRFLDGDLQLTKKDVNIYNKATVAPILINNKIGNVGILRGEDRAFCIYRVGLLLDKAYLKQLQFT